MAESLRSKALYALFWSFLESLGIRGVQFVVGIILARLLCPADFGLIGMLIFFMAMAESLIDSGFQAALIQKREPTPIDICSVFYFNIVVALFCVGLLCLAAPWIAAFYVQPPLTPLMRVLSLTILINSFGLVQNTLLTKNMDFRKVAKVSLTSGVLSGVIGISMAAHGLGVWSLVGQQISRALLGAVLIWLVNPWRPALAFSLSSLKEMFGFGSRVVASGLLNKTFDNLYFLVIGKLFSAGDLGYFTRAKTIQELPSSTLSWMVGRVTFPVLSTIQDDLPRLRRVFKTALRFVALVNCPLMIGLAVTSRPLVIVLLTEKWAECIPYIQLFCLVGLLSPVILVNLNLWFALGMSQMFLRFEIARKALIVLNVAVTYKLGISAMIYGMVVTSIISLCLIALYSNVLINYRILEQCRDLFLPLCAGVLMGLAVYCAGLASYPSYSWMLLTQAVCGVAVYLLLCRCFRLAVFMEMCRGGFVKLGAMRAALLR